MKNLFNADNWFWQRMSEIADLILLSLLWLVCCVPIVTIGPNTVAVYYVMLKKARGEADEGFWRLYVRSFRRNFKQGIVLGLLEVALFVLLYVDVRFYAQAEGIVRPLFGSLTVVGGAALLLLLPYVTGQMAQFENTFRRFFINGFYFMIRHFLTTLGMAAVSVLGVLAVWIMPPLLIVAPALVMLGHGTLLAKVFDRYTPQDGDDADTGAEAD